MLLQQTPIYTEQELRLIKAQQVPHHVALIMDGNRRWARKHFLSHMKNPWRGHGEGAKVLGTVIESAFALGIKVVTFYAFSTENWNRSSQEISILFSIFETHLKEYREKMVKSGVKFDTIGQLSCFPPLLQQEIQKTREATREGQNIQLILAMNYGGRDEIKRATQAIVEDVMEGKILKEEISESLIARYLDTAHLGDPELCIRTSGEMRISNFLLWQLAYAEFYVTDVLWPEFTSQDLYKAVRAFQNRQRRLGG